MKYFLDSSYIIDYMNKRAPRHNDVLQAFNQLLKDNNNEFIINRLVYTEVLRGIKLIDKKHYDDTLKVLNSFTEVEIKKDIYDEAISFSRFCTSKGVTLSGSCAPIDFIHFITAKQYNLALLSMDHGFNILDGKYAEFKNIELNQ
jgi:predicted nucleic acid-binding protein